MSTPNLPDAINEFLDRLTDATRRGFVQWRKGPHGIPTSYMLERRPGRLVVTSKTINMFLQSGSEVHCISESGNGEGSVSTLYRAIQSVERQQSEIHPLLDAWLKDLEQ